MRSCFRSILGSTSVANQPSGKRKSKVLGNSNHAVPVALGRSA